MSANISIAEGGKGYSFGPVKCLMVEGDNGEFYPWYPEADRALDSLSVTQNGIYRTSDRGVYGWDRVSVNVAQSDRVTGKDPETGEEKTVTVDPGTGELVETVVPVEIRVITPPTKTEYQDGETIDISGMVVKAYGANGDEMQTVPIGEITINPTTASIDEAEIRGGGNIEGIPIINEALETAEYTVAVPSVSTVGNVTFTGEKASPAYGDRFEMSAHGAPYGWYFNESSFPIRVKLWVASNTPGTYPQCTISDQNGNVLISSSGYLTEFVYTPGDLPRYYQTITVSWPRLGDGAILETTFEITVGPRSGQGDD